MSSATQHDLAVFPADGEPALVVQVRSRKDPGAHWAAALRKSLIGYGELSPKSMFLLATPGALYLWAPGSPAGALANKEFVASQIFRPYVAAAGFQLERITRAAFEVIVEAWLRDVASGRASPDALLEQSGLPKLLKGGRVQGEAQQ
jgi:hypothetical protein